jgi:glutathione synthase/RimK-type ligase-like ATP-grasp enzyme
VVTKPEFGARGADVRIERRKVAKWTRPRTALSEQFGGPWNPRVAQEFVYTGVWPRSHRVVTLFGSALLAFRVEADHGRQPLPDRGSFHGQSVVSSGQGCTFEAFDDPEIFSLAERAHAAFPRVPLLGVDILRDVDTKQLFVAELNGIGDTWDFSSPSGIQLQRQFSLDFETQFNGRRRAAAVLARVCEAECR